MIVGGVGLTLRNPHYFSLKRYLRIGEEGNALAAIARRGIRHDRAPSLRWRHKSKVEIVGVRAAYDAAVVVGSHRVTKLVRKAEVTGRAG